MKVLINFELTPGGEGGGIEQFLMGLAYGLGRLSDGDEQYILITNPESPTWLDPFQGSNQRIVQSSRPKNPNTLDRAKGLLGPLRGPAGDLWHLVRRFALGSPQARYTATLPQSDGFFKLLGGDIIHFPSPTYTCCDLPSVYDPWDLQHVYYPSFFSKADVALRETLKGAACRHCRAIVAPSRAVKTDLEQHYGLDSQKIYVIHCAPPTELYNDAVAIPQNIRERLNLPAEFALYPAQTWRHKNHLMLLDAIRILRDREGVRLNLVCTGRKNAHWPAIRRKVRDLGLDNQVIFTDFVGVADLCSLYRLAQFLVFPSLFEGAGLPVIEAFHQGLPVACSDIAPLREYGGTAALFFDPHSLDSIAASLRQICKDESLRGVLRERGKERIREFTWERTAKTYRALYRKVAGRPLSEEDLQLLATASH